MGYHADGGLLIGYDEDEDLIALGLGMPGQGIKMDGTIIETIERHLGDECGLYLETHRIADFPNATPKKNILYFTPSEKWYGSATESFIAFLASFGFNVSGEFVGADHQHWGYQSNNKNQLESFKYVSVEDSIPQGYYEFKKTFKQMEALLASTETDAVKIKKMKAMVKKANKR